MAKLTDLFTLQELQDAVDDGYVRIQRHPTKPFNIACYTEKAQFESKWNAVTENCRGLIYDDEANIVARPWRKFHNLGQVNLPTDFFDGKVEITDKVDGSLGIMYWDGQNFSLATKGSFASEQAIHGTKVLRERYLKDMLVPGYDWLYNYTILFEIVYKSNRIVLDYGDMDDLVLLGMVETHLGYYYGPTEAAGTINWKGPVAETFKYENVSDMLGHMDRPNAEGYVIRRGNFLVKAKQPDYVELHRVVTNLSERKVWEAMAAGRFNELVEIVPDEWHEWLHDVHRRITKEFNDLRQDVVMEFGAIRWALPEDATRKQFAMAAKRSKYANFLFLLLDGRNIDPVVWDAVKP